MREEKNLQVKQDDVQINANPAKSRKEIVKERLSVKYPDDNLDDEDTMYRLIDDDYKKYENDLNAYKGDADKLNEMLSSDPRSAVFLSSWSKGGDPAIELIRMYGDDIKEALDDPDKLEEIAKANSDFVKRVSEEKQFEEQYQQNLQESLSMIDKYQADKGLSDDQVDELMAYLVGIMKDGVMGIFKPESLDLAMKAKNYDTDISLAQQEGEIRGRNAKIEEKLKTPSNMGDGLPNLGGRNMSVSNTKSNRGIFELAEQAK